MVVRIDMGSNGDWNILFPQGCDFAISVCNEPDHRQAIQLSLQQSVGRRINFQFMASNLPPAISNNVTIAKQPSTAATGQPTLIRKYMKHPIVKSLLQSIEGEIVRVDPPRIAIEPHLSQSTRPATAEKELAPPVTADA